MKGTGAELLVKSLESKGIRHTFGVSGTPNLPILDAIYKTPQIRYIQTQHEQAAIYMANGYARMAKQPGICLVSPGPGTTNCMTGIAQAFYRATPSILIGAEEGTKFYGWGSSLHHGLEPAVLFKPVTKLSQRIERTDRVPEWFHTACRVASSERKGPVYLGLPTDVQNGVAEIDQLPSASYEIAPPKCNPRDIAKAAELLAQAQRPAALVGKEVTYAGANSELLELAELLAMPIAGSYEAKGVIPEDHPLALGDAGNGVTPLTIQTLQGADVLLIAGGAIEQFTTAHFSHKIIPQEAQLIQIEIDPAEIGKIYPVAIGIAGDAKSAFQDLIQEIKERKVDRRPVAEVPRIKELVQRKAEWEESLRPLKTSDKVPIQRFRLLHDLRQALPREAIVGAESGGTHQWFEYAFQALQPAPFVGGWHPMGAEFCEALGAKVAAPEQIIVCVTGDGSMMMTLSELATAVAHNIAVLCVVCHNALFGNMRQLQIERFGSRFIGTDLPIPNLANVAKEFGAFGERVEKPDQIIPAVRRALASGKPALLDVMLDTSFENLGRQAGSPGL